MEKKIMLLSGQQGSGKTTLTKALIEFFENVEWTVGIEVCFATPIKKMHDQCRDILRQYGIEPKYPVKDGPLLQFLGTEWGRSQDPEIWLKCAKNFIDTHFNTMCLSSYPSSAKIIYIVSDCRFKNEFNAFPGALRVRLECPRDLRKSRAEMWRDNEQHPSEIDLDDFARDGKFDLYLQTDTTPIDECVRMVLAKMEKHGEEKIS